MGYITFCMHACGYDLALIRFEACLLTYIHTCFAFMHVCVYSPMNICYELLVHLLVAYLTGINSCSVDKQCMYACRYSMYVCMYVCMFMTGGGSSTIAHLRRTVDYQRLGH